MDRKDVSFIVKNKLSMGLSTKLISWYTTAVKIINNVKNVNCKFTK
jgi:hypothetical protein